MRSIFSRSAKLAVMSIAVGTTTAGWAGAQVKPTIGTAPVTASLPGRCAAADKLMATNLTINPVTPKQGDRVTAKFTIKNLCDIALSIPWEIIGTGSVTHGSGVQQNVAAGQTFDVTASWTVSAGVGAVLGQSDPKNTFSELPANRTNNNKQMAITVSQISASTQGSGGTTRNVEEVLNYTKAKNAGARFAHNVENGSGCDRIGQFNPTEWAGYPEARDKSVAFVISCGVGLGGKADPVAFAGFTLKNGWSVKRVETSELAPMTNGDWQYTSMLPGERSLTPYLKMHIWANGGGRVSRWVKIVISGPEGTCPYMDQSGPCP